MIHPNDEDDDSELGNAKPRSYKQVPQVGGAVISNPTFDYLKTEEKVRGFLSQQYPTTANPAPLGLCAFALTTFVLSMFNAGGLVCKETF
jgi:hypothetical protein